MIAFVGFVVFALGAGVATAQPPARETAAGTGFPLPLDPAPPADTGKPRLFVPPADAAPPTGCAAAFDCRVRVVGAIQHNGAVELNASVLKW